MCHQWCTHKKCGFCAIHCLWWKLVNMCMHEHMPAYKHKLVHIARLVQMHFSSRIKTQANISHVKFNNKIGETQQCHWATWRIPCSRIMFSLAQWYSYLSQKYIDWEKQLILHTQDQAKIWTDKLVKWNNCWDTKKLNSHVRAKLIPPKNNCNTL